VQKAIPSAGPVVRGSRFLPGCWRLQVSIECRPIKRDNDNFAAVLVVALVLLFFNVDGRKRHRGHMTVHNIHTGTFHFRPMIDRAIRIIHKFRRRGIGVSWLQPPVVDASGRVQKVFTDNEWQPTDLVLEIKKAMEAKN